MKNIRVKYLLIGISLIALMPVVSCVREVEPIPVEPIPGKMVDISLRISVADMVAGDEATQDAMSTRLIPDEMGTGGAFDDSAPVVENLWILQFEGTSITSKLLGAPRFISNEDLPVLTSPSDYPLSVSIPLIQTAGAAYTLFVANIGEGALFSWNLSSDATLADVATKLKSVTSESDSYEVFPVSGNKTLLMSAISSDQVVLGNPLTLVFSRSVSKVTLNLSLNNPDMTIVSVQLRNIPNQITYSELALSMNGVSGSTIWPLNMFTIDYPPVTAGLPTNTQTVPLSWYVPRNQQGVSSLSTAVTTKTAYAPVNATYFEIIATKSGATPATSVFRVYPGADMISDFNLTPNYEYTIGLNVVDIGTDPTDSRVQTFGTVDYSSWATNSNSFIINPPPVGGTTVRYRIPITQVNNYWGGTAVGYGNTPSKMISAGNQWTVELIWSDLAGLFGGSGITLSKANGTGIDYFELTVPSGLPAGNFLIGIKKLGDPDFLWSWHFWVTDYAPDKFNKTAIATGVYTYPVPGGQVERYGAPPSGADLWSPGPSGVYSNAVMMDRNMGAIDIFFTKQTAAGDRGVLYYQFGRKDPFPSVLATGAFTYPSGPTLIRNTVTNPAAFYTSASGNWANEANDTNYLWNDPNVTISMTTGKSIYDPCPPGWRMPFNGVWNDFTRTGISVYSPLRDLAWGYGRGIGSVFYNITGIRYWPGTSVNDPVAGRIWYPSMGFRNIVNGSPFNFTTQGYYWTSLPNTAPLGRSMLFNANSANVGNNSDRGYGLSVRCVSE